ncbi:hypothetical protein [Paramicrobacterium agarici]|uniref:hypothetical protein n=1 Tax=Paramicrobacterium agarici TaxID=630514 RepID=UPI001151EE65|nr:hypothetical protein [Microbacterium agarici]TQO23811.1 hypothetical protein FB385_2673 [Microbacterium agarici]
MTEIKDGVYASVSGTVARTFETKNGAACEVHVQDERQKFPDRYTAWGLGDQVAEGDRVEVRGWLVTLPDTFTKRDGSEGHGVKRMVNAPKLAKHEPAQAQPEPSGDGWYDGGEPF